jgi:hypothetical protein
MKGKKWIPSYDGFVRLSSLVWDEMKQDGMTANPSLESAFEGGHTELSLDCQKEEWLIGSLILMKEWRWDLFCWAI